MKMKIFTHKKFFMGLFILIFALAQIWLIGFRFADTAYACLHDGFVYGDGGASCCEIGLQQCGGAEPPQLFHEDLPSAASPPSN